MRASFPFSPCPPPASQPASQPASVDGQQPDRSLPFPLLSLPLFFYFILGQGSCWPCSRLVVLSRLVCGGRVVVCWKRLRDGRFAGIYFHTRRRAGAVEEHGVRAFSTSQGGNGEKTRNQPHTHTHTHSKKHSKTPECLHSHRHCSVKRKA